MTLVVFWFRRDLRLEDNHALFQALGFGLPVLPIFIFDKEILKELPANDARVNFIHEELTTIHQQLSAYDSGIHCLHNEPINAWKELLEQYDIKAVFTNKDYEPYALERDKRIQELLVSKGIPFYTYKDQVIFEKNEVVKSDGKPYTVYTPYKKKWLSLVNKDRIQPIGSRDFSFFYKKKQDLLSLNQLGFKPSTIKVKPYQLADLKDYGDTRNFPAMDATSYLSPHLRFGTIGIRQVISQLRKGDEVFLSELIWREFFMQILFHFPHVVTRNFRPKYDYIQWRNDKKEFEKWCQGQTGYPMVDAGMRQLNATGYMHNRVRMVTASFLCKHLLIDWRWGEAYFAKKLLDYDLSANNGNWQWAAGTGCDAAPYFRVFNPTEQVKKFDKALQYIKQWVPEYGSFEYVRPMVEHKAARIRALETYKAGIAKYDHEHKI